MMDIEPPRPKPAFPRDLTSLGVSELEAYITELEAEIARARADIAKKQAHKAAIAGLFRTPES